MSNGPAGPAPHPLAGIMVRVALATDSDRLYVAPLGTPRGAYGAWREVAELSPRFTGLLCHLGPWEAEMPGAILSAVLGHTAGDALDAMLAAAEGGQAAEVSEQDRLRPWPK